MTEYTARLHAMLDHMMDALEAIETPKTFAEIARAGRAMLIVERLISKLFAADKSAPKSAASAKAQDELYDLLETVVSKAERLSEPVKPAATTLKPNLSPAFSLPQPKGLRALRSSAGSSHSYGGFVGAG